jgi:very-short-patch-repair endonuclease
MSSQRSDWRERLHVNPSQMEHELALRLQDDRVNCLTQVEILVTTADFYFPLESRPLIVFVGGVVHLNKTQMMKDEELRTLLRKRGFRVLELSCTGYTDKKRDELYREIMSHLGR